MPKNEMLRTVGGYCGCALLIASTACILVNKFSDNKRRNEKLKLDSELKAEEARLAMQQKHESNNGSKGQKK